MLVYDVSNKESYDDIRYWIEEVSNDNVINL